MTYKRTNASMSEAVVIGKRMIAAKKHEIRCLQLTLCARDREINGLRSQVKIAHQTLHQVSHHSGLKTIKNTLPVSTRACCDKRLLG